MQPIDAHASSSRDQELFRTPRIPSGARPAPSSALENPNAALLGNTNGKPARPVHSGAKPPLAAFDRLKRAAENFHGIPSIFKRIKKGKYAYF
eukprot:scaffold92212_cov41-Prasinocladus_malaysianus.AAC.1